MEMDQMEIIMVIILTSMLHPKLHLLVDLMETVMDPTEMAMGPIAIAKDQMEMVMDQMEMVMDPMEMDQMEMAMGLMGMAMDQMEMEMDLIEMEMDQMEMGQTEMDPTDCVARSHVKSVSQSGSQYARITHLPAAKKFQPKFPPQSQLRSASRSPPKCAEM